MKRAFAIALAAALLAGCDKATTVRLVVERCDDD
jgi:hypothetical protein